MAQGTVSFAVRQLTDTASAIDIQGDVTAGSEDALMEAFTTATEGGAACRPARLHRTRVHELGWDRTARDIARPGEPADASNCWRAG